MNEDQIYTMAEVLAEIAKEALTTPYPGEGWTYRDPPHKIWQKQEGPRLTITPGREYKKEQSALTIPHVHASLMAEYAEDARTHENPSLLWQFKDMDTKTGWNDFLSNRTPTWDINVSYRRKPTKVQMWLWNMKDNEDDHVWVTSTYSETPPIYPRNSVLGKAEYSMIEVEK